MTARQGLRSWMAGIAAVCLLTGHVTAAELRIATSDEPVTLDPHHASATRPNRIIGDLFLGLTTDAADGSVIPGAAATWQISDDGLVYTFTLREHTWSDGTPVTADDFVFALQRLLAPGTRARYASLLYTVKNAQALNEGALANPDQLGVRALGDGRLEITLEAPTPHFLEQLSHVTAFPLPRHKVEELGDDWAEPGNLVGNGPYSLSEWLPGTRLHLIKNDQFYDAGKVAIDDVRYELTEEPGTGTERFQAGEVDIQYDFGGEQVDWLKQNLPEETRITPSLGLYYFAINTRDAPFDDPKVRTALAMAIDRAAITDQVLKSGEIPAHGFVPPGTGGYGAPSAVAWQDLARDERRQRARALLAEAGFGPDAPLNVRLRYNASAVNEEVAIAVAAMWKRVLDVDTRRIESAIEDHYQSLYQGDFEVGRAAWIASYGDPQSFLALMASDAGALNYAGYASPAYDRLLNEAATTTDRAVRYDLLRQAEAMALADMPNIPLYHYVSRNLVATHVEGFVDNTKNVHRTRWMSVSR